MKLFTTEALLGPNSLTLKAMSGDKPRLFTSSPSMFDELTKMGHMGKPQRVIIIVDPEPGLLEIFEQKETSDE